MKKKANKVPPELEDVVNQIGQFIEYWGFKNVHGRIWAHVFLSDQPLCAGDIIARLGISKALVSMSIADLLEYEVIRVVGKSDRSKVCYEANPNVTQVISNVLRTRERRMLCRISSATRHLKTLPGDSSEALVSKDRLEVLCEMVKSAECVLDAILNTTSINFSDWQSFNSIPCSSKKVDL